MMIHIVVGAKNETIMKADANFLSYLENTTNCWIIQWLNTEEVNKNCMAECTNYKEVEKSIDTVSIVIWQRTSLPFPAIFPGKASIT